MKTIAFFNNKGGVGKTTLLYHVAAMFAEKGDSVLMIDLDPQANLTSIALNDDDFFNLIEQKKTIIEPIRPLIKGIGDIQSPYLQRLSEGLSLIVGDLELASLEDRLSESWNKCLNKEEPAFRFISAFHRIIRIAGQTLSANYAFIDVGPNLGALNRAALLSADYIVIPVAADLFSLQGMKNLGVTINEWRKMWREDRLLRNPDPELNLPKGQMQPIGYVVSQHGARENKPVKAYDHWANKIPLIYREFVLGQGVEKSKIELKEDPFCLGLLKHYRSLAPMSMEAHKPIFLLKPSDGAIGAHYEAVQRCYEDFDNICTKIKIAINEYISVE